MVRSKPTLPAGHGELLELPPYSEWGESLRANMEASAAWSFSVGAFTSPGDSMGVAEPAEKRSRSPRTSRRGSACG